jgi:hypothetical protein
MRPAGLKRAKTKLQALDPDHLVVIIQAPPSPVGPHDVHAYRFAI